MQRATNDTAWMLSATGELLGLTLGFDCCGEHEMGTERLRSAFGVTTWLPSGLGDRKVRKLPSELSFETFQRKPSDKRRKSYVCAFLTNDPGSIPLIKHGEMLAFWSDIGDKWHRPELDLACAWSDARFAILVRGDENIARLAELHGAFQRLDVLFGSVIAEFARRQGLTFVIDSRVSDEDRARVLAADLEHKRLLAAAETTGIEARLAAAGRRYFALSPDWRDAAKSEVHFFLNPCEQRRFNYGWFTVAELDAWIAGTGPVVAIAKAG